MPCIITGGSLLGAVRQHSILFCDDDIDITIIENDPVHNTTYKKVINELPTVINKNKYQYKVRPWEGGDKIRPVHVSNVFIDIFILRRFKNMEELKDLLRMKKNGQSHSIDYESVPRVRTIQVYVYNL